MLTGMIYRLHGHYVDAASPSRAEKSSGRLKPCTERHNSTQHDVELCRSVHSFRVSRCTARKR